MRVLARRIYWRWYGEVLLEGGVRLLMTGDVAKWLRPQDQVRLATGFKKPVLGFDEYKLRGLFPSGPLLPRSGSTPGKAPWGARPTATA